uniref:Amino acid permease family protein n=1 Tax=Ganoderma boninense TaxID=34458 RepID=A0A5K1K4I8_9APHY|nr:Amino acid permease family protein [Ganoderma boninense]
MVEDIKDFIRRLSTIHNTAAPIHAKLPPELLIQIFALVVPNHRDHIKLTHVCRAWRELILKTPEFWADMVLASRQPKRPTDFNWMIKFIQHSAPLTYALNAGPNVPFLQSLESRGHLSRLSELSIRLEDKFALLKLTMPSLETLRCAAIGHRFLDLPAPDFDHTMPSASHRFPRLRKLECLHGCLFAPSLAFPSLKVLIHYDRPLEFFLFLKGLELCVNLEELVLLNWTPPIYPPTPIPTLSLPCTVPHLRRCQIETCHDGVASCVHEFLSSVALPSNVHLLVESESVSRPAWIIPTSPPPAVVQTVDVARVKLSSDPSQGAWHHEVHGFAGDSECLTLTMCQTAWGAMLTANDCSSPLRSIADLLSFGRLASLVLQFGSGNSVTVDAWLHVLAALPLLTDLTVRISSCRHLLRALRRPRAEGEAVLCAGLRRLSIASANGGGVHELLVMAIEWRTSLGLRLEKLEYRNPTSAPLSENRLRRLQAVVPEVVASVDLRG